MIDDICAFRDQTLVAFHDCRNHRFDRLFAEFLRASSSALVEQLPSVGFGCRSFGALAEPLLEQPQAPLLMLWRLRFARHCQTDEPLVYLDLNIRQSFFLAGAGSWNTERLPQHRTIEARPCPCMASVPLRDHDVDQCVAVAVDLNVDHLKKVAAFFALHPGLVPRF